MAVMDTIQLSRRRLLATTCAVGLGALAAACTGRSPADDPSAGSGSWSFTDDRGSTVHTDGIPSRIVAFGGSAGLLADYGLQDRLVGVFGEALTPAGAASPLAGDLDVTRVSVLGNNWGEFNLEKYASLEPDLLITDEYVPDRLWYVPDSSKDKILAINPNVVAVRIARKTVPQLITRYGELAVALGADLRAPGPARAEQRFDAAVRSVREAVARRPGLRVMAASAAPGIFYVSDPRMSADLSYFAELGVELVVPDTVAADGFFEELSWEHTDKYHADLILLDRRAAAMSLEALDANPVWRGLPAVRAGQVADWQPVFRFSHAGAAPLLEDLAAALGRADKVS
ncbi:ABC transporter substrate-binding protein [Nocardia brasiliensis]|uniref:ABC transporter substrate-binding protein n=2 Tax=Nocardia brasiliensis TaxID=37326 RepID=A0A6G9XTV7_NOCBR|nr:ABC transporter substrate-binding protein [Nocardia brasiliensis]